MPTEVKACFFKPTGYEDTFIVDTENRGRAALAVMSRCQDAEMMCLNSISCRLITEDNAIRLVREMNVVRLQVDCNA